MYALKPFIFYHHRAYYARPSLSIMPGQTWRDNGHKALCPLSRPCSPPAYGGSPLFAEMFQPQLISSFASTLTLNCSEVSGLN